LPFTSQPRAVPSENEIDAAQYSLTSIRNDIRSRKEEAVRREGLTVETTSWFSRVGPLFRGDDSLTQELQALHVLEHDMSTNLIFVNSEVQIVDFGRTLNVAKSHSAIAVDVLSLIIMEHIGLL